MDREDLREGRGDLLIGIIPAERIKGGARAPRMEDQLLIRQNVISPGRPDGAAGGVLQDGVFNGNIETKALGRLCAAISCRLDDNGVPARLPGKAADLRADGSDDMPRKWTKPAPIGKFLIGTGFETFGLRRCPQTRMEHKPARNLDSCKLGGLLKKSSGGMRLHLACQRLNAAEAFFDRTQRTQMRWR